MRFQFIDGHREAFPVIRMCAMLDVSPSGYYAWHGRPPSMRDMANRELMDKIDTKDCRSYWIRLLLQHRNALGKAHSM